MVWLEDICTAILSHKYGRQVCYIFTITHSEMVNMTFSPTYIGHFYVFYATLFISDIVIGKNINIITRIYDA